MRKLFGTDGIRGMANREPVTAETVLRLGQALGQALRRAGGRREVVVGRDTRLSGPMLEGALLAGLCSAGIDVQLAGIVPTPAVAWLTRESGAAAGAVVSASHNPFADNGLKFFAGDGFKLADSDELEIEAVMAATSTSERPLAEEIGRVRLLPDARTRYLRSLASSLPQGFRLDGVPVVIDCANGAAYECGPELFESLGAKLTVLGDHPNGSNINSDCGALHPEALRRRVIAEGASLGIAVDGDADRLLLVDERGDPVDGDDILGMLAVDRVGRGLAPEPVVGTVMSNLGLELTLRALGVELVRTAVGDRYVVEEMRRRAVHLGGEPSGHLIFLEHSTTGDGLLAALQVVELMVRTGQPLSGLRRAVTKCPQALLNVTVARRQDLATLPALQHAIAAVQAALHDRGRVLVRYSGTEPLVRVMVEGEDEGEVQRQAQQLAEAVRAALAQS